jgi:murein tripeptide amidase MpaA
VSTTDPLLTLAERSDFAETGRTDEVQALCAAFMREWPDAVRCFEYGRSAEGRAMQALIVSRVGLSAQSLRQARIPLLMIQAGIHPGESDGKDAGFIALREILFGASAPSVLERLAILFVPAFNVDGHERVGRWNRPNQNGPRETGWRTTAQNLNLNRDYLKAAAPEMQAMLRLIDEWDPLVCADLHVTDGADFEPDISIQVEPINQGDERLQPIGLKLREELIVRLADQGSLPLPFYPDLAITDDPASGFLLTVYSPRFSTGYFPQRNRFTVLVETHSWKAYARRVAVTRNCIVGLAEMVAAQGAAWLAAAAEADAAAARLGGREAVLDYSCGWREPAQAGAAVNERAEETASELIEFRGYAYTRSTSPISGNPVTVYDPNTPQIWRVPYRKHVRPSLTVMAPLGGYLVPCAYATLIASKLDLHGIAFRTLSAGRCGAAVEVFRATRAQFSAAPFEGRMRVKLDGGWRSENRDVGAGALFVAVAQPLSRLVLALLEPAAPDSLAAWGYFNACFEHKEHMEPYVAEQIARDMAAADPQLSMEFERRLQDPVFAGDARARLEFFLRRHSSWDENFNLYPVLRSAQRW